MKILITGGTGMVGSAFNKLDTDHELILVGSQECDLRIREDAQFLLFVHNPDAIIHLAARVGGIKANMERMGEFYYDNILINTNVLEAAKSCGTPKVVSLLSTCVYPDKITYPLKEKNIHNGPPHASNYAYAYAKRMLDIQSQAYRKQFGCNFTTAVPNNLFGENDNYHLKDSHVIPAIIHKMYLASKNGEDVELWGDGSPLREFTYSRDLARILLFLVEKYDGETPINVGNTREYSIKEIALKIKEFMKFEGNIAWNTSAPAGQLRKPSCNAKFLELGWDKEQYTPLDRALKDSCTWFRENYPNVRGVK